MTFFKSARVAIYRAALLGTALTATTAFAQSEDAAQDPGNADDSIKEIVVTARFRTETLQDTPIAISAVAAESVEKIVITDVNSLQRLLPNVQLSRINFAGQALGASIRGISFADLEKSFDPAIGVVIDGVFLGTNTGANIDFDDLESIEVLRGPQGTLFGRNTIGGTISVRHTRPTGELGGKFKARYGSFNSLDLEGVLNLPQIADALSIKLAGLRRTSDSPTINRYTNEREDGRDIYNLSATALLEVGDFTALGTVAYNKDRSRYPTAINLTRASGLAFGAGGNICDYTLAVGLGDLGCDTQGSVRQATENFRLANTSIPFESFFEGWAASLELNGKVGGFNVTAITGWRKSNDQLTEENTGTPPVSYTGVPGQGVPLFVAARDQDYEQFSQEIRVAGDITDWMDIVAGVYYLNTKYSIRPGEFNGSRAGLAWLAVPLFPPAVPAPTFINVPIQGATASQELDSFAVFAESIFKLSDNVRLTAGGRYTIETKEFALNQTLAVPFTGQGKETWRDPTWRVILDWKPTDDTMLYGSWSRGFRSGGWNGRATTAAAIGPYNPETVDSYEIGAKTEFADGKMQVNLAAFLVNYDDKQEEIIRPAVGGGTETIVDNAANAQTKGIELEWIARPTSELTFRAAGAYLSAKYKDFLIPNLAVPGQFIDITNVANFRRAPKWTGNVGMDYDKQLDDRNSINFNANLAYLDDFFTSPRRDPTGRNRDTIAAHTTLDASLAFLHTGDTFKRMRIAVYGRDLLNKGNRLTNTLDAGVFYFGVVSANREGGVEFSIEF
ncbi:TonB-dependent receptor [Porphyrobacter sp. LM 6]|uniref:TonB-dependent receptor n=1 Tax=Porphyrobacter sp. LM 6 TaxID=1896196 RepID=UPI000846CC48|nr:TonB-dependent receptor [Porphyrobacter sp. LM 6]AOL94074.1 TonB-dependent outer membrane channel [Porphyrobacter sp. LM 6]